jgi:tryptophanyl-tRNA synthetase
VTLPRLERLPTIKDMAQAADLDVLPFGLVGYPVLQAADILLPRAHVVPVGKDNLSHVEITREIARRFNHLYGRVFPEPDAILAKTSKVLGWDRRKMSKSYDNAIYLSDDPEVAMEKVSRFITDPDRKRRADPGNPDICNVFDYHKLYSSPALVHEIGAQCRAAGIGCVECKRKMGENLLAFLAPIRERRVHFEGNPDRVAEIAAAGGDKARGIARRTLEEVRAAVRI